MIHDVPAETLKHFDEIQREIRERGNLRRELEKAGFSLDEVRDLMIQAEEVFETDYGFVMELREFGGESSVRTYLKEAA